MGPFCFRLARVLNWYEKQSRLEAERLRVCIERSAQTKVEIERHLQAVRSHEMEVIASPEPQVVELASLDPFRHRARQQEIHLRQQLQKNQKDLERQRDISQAAQRRLRLVEKLRDRQLSDHEYEAAKELEELASDTYLARFARILND